MDENISMTAEQTADQQNDGFLSGWDDEPATEEAADQPETETEGETAEDGADTQAAETAEAEQAEAAETKAEVPSAAEPETQWKLNYMGEEKTLGAKDITPELLQKGLDYDRVREKYNESKPVMEVFAEFAKRSNMTVAEYVKFVRAEAKKASGMTEEEAKRAVELEDREAVVAAKEEAQREAGKAKEAADAKVRADLQDFANAFPEVYAKARSDPKAIPQSVWDKVSGGKMSLTAAYAQYAVEAAKAEAQTAAQKAEVAAQNDKNAARTTGSMKSAGSDVKNTDPFLAGFND